MAVCLDIVLVEYHTGDAGLRALGTNALLEVNVESTNAIDLTATHAGVNRYRDAKKN